MREPEGPPVSTVGGPVCTRTADRSLHVSLLPTGERTCSFDCLYCPFPRSRRFRHWPLPGDLGSAVRQALHRTPEIESITVSGPGEPTLHPRFGRALADVLGAREVRPDLPVRVVTNGTTLIEPRVRRLLSFADERVVRIDAGGERISRPHGGAGAEAIDAALRQLPDFSAESFFVEGADGNIAEADVSGWIDRLAALRPQRVYVTTVAEAPLEPGLRRASEATLVRIAAELRRRTGLEVTVLP